MNRWIRRLAPLAAVGLIAAGCSSSPSNNSTDLHGQSVTVIGTWGGSEQDAFLKMVKPWEDQTGATVKYTGTRDINTVLTAGVASGVLPDLAGIPGPGAMQDYVKAGALVNLDNVLDLGSYTNDTAPALVTLGKANGSVYGVFIKAAVKGLIWYNKKAKDYSANAPKTWADLQAAIAANPGTPGFCLGIESGAASGWPATDVIADLVLRTAGPDVYTSWYEGKTKWTDPAIKNAFQMYMTDVVAHTYGGATNAVATNFATAGDPLFNNPPSCQFLDQASFITGLGKFKNLTAGTDYDFFSFPDINSQYAGAVQGAGDLFGMFHNTPAAKSLMAYLVTPQAQDIWVKIGGALSANKKATDYPDDISKRSAQLLTNAKYFVFGAGDNMPNAMQGEFWKDIVAVTGGSMTIDAALSDLDATQKTAYTTS